MPGFLPAFISEAATVTVARHESGHPVIRPSPQNAAPQQSLRFFQNIPKAYPAHRPALAEHATPPPQSAYAPQKQMRDYSTPSEEIELPLQDERFEYAPPVPQKA
ncbi:hypothetical protein AA106556_0589 [Neokomagataea tanensis NBRC 106556]|uniref:Uncharacterized protein n=1 Tax=Neokomagataea tanensis NBRC 106556 TaxID=1223519 RepID=A0ABQ0QHG6_9PROT|nr:hypothetical protein AA106556_0589 [Neokomagataea tanensis NBRC 106556]